MLNNWKFGSTTALVFACIVSSSIAALAEPAPLLHPAGETWTESIFRDFASPVTTPARTALAAGAGATALLYGFKYEIGDPLQRSWQRHHPLARTSEIGNDSGQMIPNALYTIGMAIDGWGFDSDKSKRRAILMLKATAYAGIVNTALKYAVQEPRPNGTTSTWSFPSGHAATAFAFASVVGAEHEWYYGLASYLLASFVAASRINDNQHRLHDVVGGATVGISYGLGLYYRSHPDDFKIDKTTFQVLPTERTDGFILTALREF